MATIEERANKLFCDKDGYVRDMIDDYKRLGYIQGATEQQKIDIEKLKDIMNRLMLDTKDKAEIIKAMEE